MGGEKVKHLHTPQGLNDLPDTWQWLRLEDACDGVFDCPHSTPAVTDSGPLMVRTQDILTGIFRADQAAHVSEETYQERVQRAEPQYGDLLYSREGTYFGIAAEVPPNQRVCLGQRMVLLRPNAELVHSRFLRYWLNSPLMERHIHGFRDGTVAQRLNLSTIRALPVLIPPVSTQQAIACILGTLDDKIELNRRMNETLEATAQAIFKSWFVDFDPVRAKVAGHQPSGLAPHIADLFPDAFEVSESGDIPKGWRKGSVGEDFNITMGQSPPGETYNEKGDGLPFYQGRRDFGFRYPSLRVYCTAPTRFARPGDTLVSVRAPVGDINMAAEDCCVGRGVAAVRHQTGSRSYTYYAMKSLRAHFDRFEAEGTVFGSLNKRDFHNLSFLIPPTQVIDEFEKQVFPIDELIETSKQQAQTLAELRDTLLPKLVSGQI